MDKKEKIDLLEKLLWLLTEDGITDVIHFAAEIQKREAARQRPRGADRDAAAVRWSGCPFGLRQCVVCAVGGRRMGQNGTRGVLQRRGPDAPQRPPGRGKSKRKAKAHRMYLEESGSDAPYQG